MHFIFGLQRNPLPTLIHIGFVVLYINVSFQSQPPFYEYFFSLLNVRSSYIFRPFRLGSASLIRSYTYQSPQKSTAMITADIIMSSSQATRQY